MLNRIVLVGRLTRNPEIRYTSQGKPVTNFTLAVDRPFANSEGNREADFIDIVCWGKLAETTGNHLKKGRLVAVEGRLHIRSYEAKDGSKGRSAEVVADGVRFLDRPRHGESQSSDESLHYELPDDLPF